jgi:hypothetical protein
VPTAGEMKRTLLAFESRLDEELTFAINTLLLSSVNQMQAFVLD